MTGRKPELIQKRERANFLVIVGTIEKNKWIQELAQKGKIDIRPLQGAWERYLIQTIDKPYPGVDKALVIAGSDRRGAAYGLFSISEMIGVSPWYWWADVPIKSMKHCILMLRPLTLKLLR